MVGSLSSRRDQADTTKRLPARTSRGTRIRKLIGEEAEADAAFWNQDAWNEDGEDDDYSTEEEEEDVVDSDFDEDEAPDEDVHDEVDDDSLSTRRRVARGEPRRAVYKEPNTIARATKKVKFGGSDGGGTSAAARAATPLVYEAPQLRQSTARKTSDSSELRQKILTEAAKLSEKARKPPVMRPRLTQEQLLVEAVRTEVENTQSLSRLEQLEEEKKAENQITPKSPFTGLIVRYHSRIGMPKSITFLNSDQFPSIFNQPKASKRQRRLASAEEEEALQEECDEGDEDDEDEEAISQEDIAEEENATADED